MAGVLNNFWTKNQKIILSHVVGNILMPFVPIKPPLGKALKMIYRPFPTTNRVKDSAVAVALIFLKGFKKMSWTLLLILSTFSGSHFCTHCHLYRAPLYQTFHPISLFSTKLLGKCHLNKALKINKLFCAAFYCQENKSPLS